MIAIAFVGWGFGALLMNAGYLRTGAAFIIVGVVVGRFSWGVR